MAKTNFRRRCRSATKEAASIDGGASLQESRAAILEAAAAEFSARGFDGARMDSIAKRSGYNRALVYRYFTDKKGLFEAVLRHKVEQHTDLAHRMPDELTSILKSWFQQSLRDPSYLRLLSHEALNDTGATLSRKLPDEPIIGSTPRPLRASRSRGGHRKSTTPRT